MSRTPHSTSAFRTAIAAMSVVTGCGTEIIEPEVEPDPAVIEVAMDAVSFAVVQGGDEPVAVSVAITNGGEADLTAMTVSVTYGESSQDWLTATLDASTAPTTLSLVALVSLLPEGEHQATVEIDASGASNGPVAIAVAVVVTLPPEDARIGTSERRFELEVLEGDPNPDEMTVEVENLGELPLDDLDVTVVYGVGEPTDWIVATLDGSEAPTTLRFQALADQLEPGSYGAQIGLVSEAASNSPEYVRVDLDVIAVEPLIAAEPSFVRFEAVEGRTDPGQRVIQVQNGGLGELTDLTASVDYADGHPSGWLSMSFDATTAPTILRLDARTGALPAGTHEATVSVLSPHAPNSPVVIDLEFVVRPPGPLIAADPLFLSFNAARGGTSPAAQTFEVTNADAGDLTDLSLDLRGTPWLAATLDRTTAPATVTVTVDPATLPVDVHNADIEIHSPVADNSPISVGVAFTIAEVQPDIVVQGPLGAMDPVPAGESTSSPPVTYVNESEARAQSFLAGWYLSTDESIESSDILVRSIGIQSLDGLEERTYGSALLEIPEDVPPGEYWLGILADRENVVHESDETNNALSTPITIEPALVRHTVTLMPTPPEGGFIDGRGSDPEVLEGTELDLFPIPADGWVFTGWGGDASGDDIPFAIVVDGDKTIIANFAPAPALN